MQPADKKQTMGVEVSVDSIDQYHCVIDVRPTTRPLSDDYAYGAALRSLSDAAGHNLTNLVGPLFGYGSTPGAAIDKVHTQLRLVFGK